MAEETTQIVKGQNDWQAPLNELLKLATSGVTPQHIANPVTFSGGATGTSDAYVWNGGDYKLVSLSINHANLKDVDKNGSATILQVPDNLTPVQPVRIGLTQTTILANEFGWHPVGFIMWDAGTTNVSDVSGTTVYLAKA